MIVEIDLPVPPVAKERARVTRFGAYTPARTKEFERQVIYHLKRYYLDGLLGAPLKVYVEFHLPKPRKTKFKVPAVRPDLDNYIKSLFDAFNDIVWKDDALVCELDCKKVFAVDKPKIKVRIEEL